jgi:hypothetical protein
MTVLSKFARGSWLSLGVLVGLSLAAFGAAAFAIGADCAVRNLTPGGDICIIITEGR